ncbi:adenine deaminase [Flammeovirga sp. SubArs3]|uniref:adenine deaminase n=1 Tax=Flammeovirga sp. SubArs3 TaxID=2995316 RepID=UPI00248AE681|nr:adenine deaminase [Flammeovirga sp. SubArs3]
MEKIIFGNIVDVHRRIIYPGKLTIAGKHIKDIRYDEEAKGSDKYIMPGFVDAHIHIESSMLSPTEFAKIAVRHGTVATVSDPHEIANVLGVEGVNYMIEEGKKTPFKFNYGAPSCVPATDFETSGARITSKDIKNLMIKNEIKYLAEMMNWPGVLNNDEEVYKKIQAAKESNKPIDGHAPGLKGKDAEKYASAGISTDHECVELDEALDKINAGMKILIREGSAAKNYEALSPLLKSHTEQLMFCTDDSHPHELINGHIDRFIKRSFDIGADLFEVIKIASIYPINHYNLDVGQLRKGDFADFVVIESMTRFKPVATYINGEKVAENGRELFTTPAPTLINNFNCSHKMVEEIQVSVKYKKVRTIVAHDGQLITSSEIIDTSQLRQQDALKMVVINRYNDAPPSIGYIKGFGLKEGAIASTVAHDCHNIIAVGVNDEEIIKAVNEVIRTKGGIAVSNIDEVTSFPLPIAGLMSNLSGEVAAEKYNELLEIAKSLGSTLHDPYMTLSFMALLVIPALKLSDKGLFDGQKFEFVSLTD